MAVMMAVDLAVPAFVVIVTVPAVSPAGIVIEAGMVAEGSLDVKFTTTPFAPAGALRVTVAVDELPGLTEVELKLMALTPTGRTVKDTAFVTSPPLAMSVTT